TRPSIPVWSIAPGSGVKRRHDGCVTTAGSAPAPGASMPNRRSVVKSIAALAAPPLLHGLPAAADPAGITLAYPIDVPSWDPIAASSLLTISLYKCVFDKPLNIMPDLSFGPSVVADYKFLDTSGKVLALEFRPDITFHNGDRLSSDDFKFTFFDRI